MRSILTSIALLLCSSTIVSLRAQISITLDSSIKYQTMVGWEFALQASAEKDSMTGGPNPFFDLYKDTLFDLAVNDLGLNRVRLQLRSGSENDTAFGDLYYNGIIDRNQYKKKWFQIKNDNNDPYTINPAGFHFGELDRKIESTLLPIKQRLQQNGEDLYVNLCITDFGQNNSAGSTVEFQTDSAEYAEFVLAAFQHIQSKYGWYPDGLEIILEPEHHWGSGTNVGQNLLAAAKRLEANGFYPEFIAPSYSYFQNTLSGTPKMLTVQGVLNYVDELSYHCYAKCNIANFIVFDSIASANNLRTSQLEKIGRDYTGLYEDLKYAKVSAWQQYSLAYWIHNDTVNINNDDGGVHYLIDKTIPQKPKVITASRTKLLRQYFKFIRKGAVRIEATTSDSVKTAPLAFINTDGNWAVVVKTTGTNTAFSISGLPPGKYGIKYTTGSAYDIDLADKTILSGGKLTTTMPATGVMTIYGKDIPTTINKEINGLKQAVVFPNPVKAGEVIQISGVETVFLYDISGRLIQESGGNIDTKNILPGVYFAKLFSNTYGAISRKIIVY